MMQRTSADLHRQHIRLHAAGIPHNCSSFRREERELLRAELAIALCIRNGGDCPVYCWTWYPRCEN